MRVIQGALNRLEPPAGTERPQPTTGRASNALGEQVRRFQRYALGARRPDGRVDPRGGTWRALAGLSGRKRIVVSLEEQWLWALQDGRVVGSFLCVSGDGDHPTDRGIHAIFRKEHPYRSRTYDAQMDYAMFFTKDGKAIHQWHGPIWLGAVRTMRHSVSDYFGSHGCVRVEQVSARWLYQWAPLHTEVHVF